MSYQQQFENRMPTDQPTAAGKAAVVLVHGLCGHRLVMAPLAARLRKAGFHTINWGYRSMGSNIAAHAARFHHRLNAIAQNSEFSTIHIVAHSMGCIVTRQAILQGPPDKLHRIVMLCPPNRGSRVATRLAPFFGRFCKTLVEISDQPGSWVNQLPTTLAEQFTVGLIIAGGDLVVRPDSTYLPGVDEIKKIPGMHSGILLKASTAEAVINFLRTGRF